MRRVAYFSHTIGENFAAFGLLGLQAMPIQTQSEFNISLTAEWFAGKIPSPVLRLRFLREFMPPVREPQRKSPKTRFLVAFSVVALLLTAPVRPSVSDPPPATLMPT